MYRTEFRVVILLISILFLGISSCGLIKDSDNDGIKDKHDSCPNTQFEIQVDDKGCPIDTDKDGIPDHIDECPNVAGSEVNKGCPAADNDGDGISDSEDECPNSPGSASTNGCPDEDGDGIRDSEDDCPGRKGPIANRGCPLPTPEIIELFAEADAHFRLDEYDAAEELYEKILELDEGNLEALGKLMEIEGLRPVGVIGVLLDADEDGVADDIDECPGTKIGLIVDAKGCPVEGYSGGQSAEQLYIEYASDSIKQDTKTKEKSHVIMNIVDKGKVIIGRPYYLRIFAEKHADKIEYRQRIFRKVNGRDIEEGPKESDRYRVQTLSVDEAYKYKFEFQFTPDVLTIDTLNRTYRKLSRSGRSVWSWKVTGKKEISDTEVFLEIFAVDKEGEENHLDSDFINMSVEVLKEKKAWTNFEIGVSGGIIALILTGVVLWFIKRKRIVPLKKVYFSYAWGEEGNETIVDSLYKSLVDDGFNVVRDKVNLEYKGEISDFMTEIGQGKMIVVALSDKYLKSKFCVFELFEIYRNSRMDKDKFVKKIFPIRVEDINLSDPKVVNYYVNYWKEEENKWVKNIEENGVQSVSPEQVNQLQLIKRIVIDLGSILDHLSDINALDINTMQHNNFEDIKSALRKATVAISKRRLFTKK